MRIGRITVRTAMVPLPEPHRTASGTLTHSPLVLVGAETEGAAGNAVAFAVSPRALGPLARMVEALAEDLPGQPLAPAALSDALAAKLRLLGTKGIAMMALSALDMALWDALARTHGVGLHALLGAAPAKVRAYGNLGCDGEAVCGAGAERLARAGFRGIKAKIGYPTLAEDLRVIRAMRAGAGPDVAIMVDYNQSLSEDEAALRLRALAGEGLTWVEEPVGAHEMHALARLGRETGAPVQAGEGWWGVRDFADAVAAGHVARAMPDAGRCGGVTGWMRIAGLAAGHGTALSSHLWPELSAQLLAATPTAAWLEYVDWWNPILAEPLRLADGLTDIAGTLGSGMALDEAALARWLS